MSNEVWLCMPVVNEEMCNSHVPMWKDQGYKIALWQDNAYFDVPSADIVINPTKHYPGYANTVNFLVKNIIPNDCGLVVFAGEDMLPDQNHKANEISDIFFDKFEDGYGVMQPIGDDLPGTERICGSPFVGKPFARNWNMGMGALWPGYNHYFADEELFTLTKSAGLLFQNPDLTHYHDHWTRTGVKPEHHKPLQRRWEHDKALFHFRKEKGFPGCEPLNLIKHKL